MHAVILGQPSLPQFLEKARSVPVLKVLMHRARRTELAGQCFPLDACPQNVNDGREDLPRRHRLAPSSGLALVLSPRFPLAYRDQRLNPAPQIIRNRPRLDLPHAGYSIAAPHRRQESNSSLRTKFVTIYG
jgi:hypothetical protein